MLIVNADQLTETVAPTVEPVTVSEAKDHLRVTVSTDDTLIGNLITAARQMIELYCGRSFAKHTYRADIGQFGDEMLLPYRPIQSITSVKYYNTDSPTVLTTLSADDYALSVASVMRNYGVTWPNTYPRRDAVKITYVAGYSDLASPEDTVANVPQAVKQGILLEVGGMYENRESLIYFPGVKLGGMDAINPAVKGLLGFYRVYL